MRTAAWPLLAAMLLAVLGVLVHIPMLTTAVDVPVMVGEQQFTLRLPDDADQATLQQGIAEMSAAFQKVSASRPRRREFESSTTSARIGLSPAFGDGGCIPHCALARAGRGVGYGLDRIRRGFGSRRAAFARSPRRRA